MFGGSTIRIGGGSVEAFVEGDLFRDREFFATGATLQAQMAAVVRAPLAHFTIGAWMFLLAHVSIVSEMWWSLQGGPAVFGLFDAGAADNADVVFQDELAGAVW
jgi:hypothetical protein